jgi:hypothetical protein
MGLRLYFGQHRNQHAEDQFLHTKKPLSRSGFLFWRRDPESNWAPRICNPLHNRFAIAPLLSLQKREAFMGFPFFIILERETRLELATSTLARLRSTN